MRVSAAMRLSVWVTFGLGLVTTGLGCIDSVESDGQVRGLLGGQTVDAATGLAPQNPPAPGAACTASGKPGQPCTMASTCCGVTEGSGICFFNGETKGVCQSEPKLGLQPTWSELYKDYFGGTGRAACAGNGTCHGTMSGAGFLASSGYLCPPDDPDTCWKTLTSSSVGIITPGQAFEEDGLYQDLRKLGVPVGIGNMPYPPQVYSFTATDLDRISTWIMNGAKND
jgi:hypothetical protein